MHTKPIRDALDKNKKAIVEDIKRAASGQEQEFRDGLSAAGCDITKLPRDSLDSFVQALLHRLIETEDDSTLLKVIQYLKDFCRRSDHIKQLARLVETVDTDNRKVPKQYSPPPEVPIPPLPKERHDYALKTTPINSIRTILSSRIGTKIGPTDCREAGRICGLPHASISFATAVANADRDISLLFGVIEHLGHIREAAKAVNAGHEGLIIPPEEICNIEKLENRLDHFFESLSISLDLALVYLARAATQTTISFLVRYCIFRCLSNILRLSRKIPAVNGDTMPHSGSRSAPFQLTYPILRCRYYSI
jgi:hypothetical protein